MNNTLIKDSVLRVGEVSGIEGIKVYILPDYLDKFYKYECKLYQFKYIDKNYNWQSDRKIKVHKKDLVSFILLIMDLKILKKKSPRLKPYRDFEYPSKTYSYRFGLVCIK